MPALTRKRANDRPLTWHVHYAGVRVGMIVERSGVANTAEPWEWHCGFYPGNNPGESDFQEWRDQEAWTAEKYRRFDRPERMPSDWKPQRAAGG
jgi:hypothetical protein